MKQDRVRVDTTQVSGKVLTTEPRNHRVWEAIGGRKFLGYEETLLIILGIGIFVEDYRMAGVLVGGALAAYVLYAVANVVKAKINIGGTTIETNGGNGKNDVAG